MYRKASLQLMNEKNKLCNSAKKASRQQFFDTIDTREVSEQLDLSLLGLEQKEWKPEMVEHEIGERKHIADMPRDRTTALTDEAKLGHRICTIRALVDSEVSYRGEACQHLDLDLVGLEVKGHFRIRKVQPEVWCSRK